MQQQDSQALLPYKPQIQNYDLWDLLSNTHHSLFDKQDDNLMINHYLRDLFKADQNSPQIHQNLFQTQLELENKQYQQNCLIKNKIFQSNEVIIPKKYKKKIKKKNAISKKSIPKVPRKKRPETSVFKIIYTKFRDFLSRHMHKKDFHICLDSKKILMTSTPNRMSFQYIYSFFELSEQRSNFSFDWLRNSLNDVLFKQNIVRYAQKKYARDQARLDCFHSQLKTIYDALNCEKGSEERIKILYRQNVHKRPKKNLEMFREYLQKKKNCHQI